jgi:receptor expression-enhancing protein 5/6
MEYINNYFDTLSKSFDEIPSLKCVADRLNIKTGHIAFGSVAFVFLFVIFGIGKVFLTNLLGIVYPAYMSFKAIESQDTDDDKQWLTYWVVYGNFTVVDSVAEVLLSWVPFYHPAKLIILVYLAWPETRGAEMVYQRIVRPFMVKHETKVDEALERIGRKAGEVRSEVAKQAEDYHTSKTD